MASAMASTASRNIPPPYTIPVGPRVRPPRLLPGTKAANTNPRPNEPPPTPGHVWVQGKWRDPGSNAARDRRQLESTQAEKALKRATHGMNIYAYSHIRTNQVVYSLSRIMQNNKILEQLMFHGKQTVPSALRRDMWRPYFSIHFDGTPAGAEAGLQAYRRLRELATQRQLSPPLELITATAEDVRRAESKYDPDMLLQKRRNKNLKNMPVKNQTLPQKLRARKLMDQKATSVADAALVLGLLEQGPSPAEALDAAAEKRQAKIEALSGRASKRLGTIKEKETAKEAQIVERQETVQPGQGRLGLTPHAAGRVAIEHGGTVTAPQKGMEYQVETPEDLKQLQQKSAIQLLGERRPAAFNEEAYRSQYVESWKKQNPGKTESPSDEDISAAVVQEQTRTESKIAEYEMRLAEARGTDVSQMLEHNMNSRKVHILWADFRDATWAERWSGNVFHGELDPRAALKHEKIISRGQMTVDEEGNEIPGYQKKFVVQNSTTPHIFGVNNQTGWYETPEKLSEQRKKWRDGKAAAWQDEKLQLSKELIQKMADIHQEKMRLQNRARDVQPDFDATTRADESAADDKVINTPTEAKEYEVRTSMSKARNSIAKIDQQLQAFERDYPLLHNVLSQLLEWRHNLETYATLSDIKNELQDLKSTSEPTEPKISQRLQEIDQLLTLYAAHQEGLQQLVSSSTNTIKLQSDLLANITDSNQRIAQYEQRITSLEATDPESPDLQETRNLLDNERDFIVSALDDSSTTRINAVDDTLIAIENAYNRSGVIDLLRQRMHAQQSGNTDAVQDLTAELKEREDDELSSLLGVRIQIESRQYQLNERSRESGIEMPPPKEMKGFMGRIRSFFGR